MEEDRRSNNEDMGLGQRAIFEDVASRRPQERAEYDKSGMRYRTRLLQLSGVDLEKRNKYIHLSDRMLEYSSVLFAHSLCVTALAVGFVDTLDEQYFFDPNKESLLQARASDVKKLLAGALLHDVGKLGLDHRLLSRTTSLHEEDKRKIRQHPIMGFGMIIEPGMEVEAYLALAHHYTPDQKGYFSGMDDDPRQASYLAFLHRIEKSIPGAQESRHILILADSLDASGFGRGRSMSTLKYDPDNKEDVMRVNMQRLTTPNGVLACKEDLVSRMIEYGFPLRLNSDKPDYSRLLEHILSRKAA